MNSTRLAQLIDAYLDCALSPEDASELSGMMVRSAEARKQFWSQASLHGVLPEAVQTQWLAQAVPEAARKVVPIPVEHRGAARYFWLAAAACLALCAGWWGMNQGWGSKGGRVVAEIERAPGATLRGKHSLDRGTSMKVGRYHLTDGAVEIAMQSGARLIVEAPADFELLGRNEARLHSGRCSGYVPPEASGFKVFAPDFVLVDLGTSFGIKVPPSGPAEAHVFEGEVELDSGKTTPLRLVQGEAVEVSDGVFSTIVVRPEEFLTASRLAARDSEKTKRKIDQWRDLSERLSSDPATLVHFSCDGQELWDTALHNAARTPDADRRTAMIIGAAWAEGRWPGKKAIAFREAGNRVRFEVPGRPQQLTLLASICVDALPNDFNALLMTENLAMGDLRWQILRNGELELGIRTGKGGDGEKFERVATGPVIGDAMLNRWLTIASTYDGATGEIVHYVEGEQVAKQKIERITPVALGALELGNWGIQLDDPKWTWTKESGPAFYRRNFVGKIDQFAMLSRVLRPEEVRKYSLAR